MITHIYSRDILIFLTNMEQEFDRPLVLHHQVKMVILLRIAIKPLKKTMHNRHIVKF